MAQFQIDEPEYSWSNMILDRIKITSMILGLKKDAKQGIWVQRDGQFQNLDRDKTMQENPYTAHLRNRDSSTYDSRKDVSTKLSSIVGGLLCILFLILLASYFFIFFISTAIASESDSSDAIFLLFLFALVSRWFFLNASIATGSIPSASSSVKTPQLWFRMHDTRRRRHSRVSQHSLRHRLLVVAFEQDLFKLFLT